MNDWYEGGFLIRKNADKLQLQFIMLTAPIDVEAIRLSPTKDFITIDGKLKNGAKISISGKLTRKINPSGTLLQVSDLKQWSSLIMSCKQDRGKIREIFIDFIDHKPLSLEDNSDT